MESEQQKTNAGFRGVWNWLTGKPKVTGKLLYGRMVEHAGWMLNEIDADRSPGVMREVMRFTGADP